MYQIAFIVLWCITGLITLQPFINNEVMGQMGAPKIIFTFILFLMIGPLVGLANVLATLINLYFYGSDDGG